MGKNNTVPSAIPNQQAVDPSADVSKDAEIADLRRQLQERDERLTSMDDRLTEVTKVVMATTDRHKLQHYNESQGKEKSGTRGFVRTYEGKTVKSWRTVVNKVSAESPDAGVQTFEVTFTDGSRATMQMVKMTEFDRQDVRFASETADKQTGKVTYTVVPVDAAGDDCGEQFDILETFLN